MLFSSSPCSPTSSPAKPFALSIITSIATFSLTISSLLPLSLNPSPPPLPLHPLPNSLRWHRLHFRPFHHHLHLIFPPVSRFGLMAPARLVARFPYLLVHERPKRPKRTHDAQMTTTTTMTTTMTTTTTKTTKTETTTVIVS